MSTPFPGMDPYLENPLFWPDVHNSLIAEIRNDLAPKLLPRYYVALEERLYMTELHEREFVTRPDLSVIDPSATPVAVQERSFTPLANGQPTVEPVLVAVPVMEEVRETYLEVREAKTHVVVTVIELLSPANKRPGPGRAQYEEKRLQVLSSRTHLIEVDLLRQGEPMAMTPLAEAARGQYRILVSRWQQRPQAVLLPFTVRQPIPSFYLPLQPNEATPAVDVTRLLHALIDHVGYQLRIDYTVDPTPPLQGDDAAWADALLRSAGLRP